MPDPADIIRQRASKVVRGVLQDDVGFARWVKRMVAHTITEYRGRFIHELVQNGYDAHPVGTTTGRIAVHFDETEGDHGVLYVANGGDPLSEENFNRMASLADSDKDIGVGIGNKGIGFKSVFQVCQVPEVYSARDVEDPGLSGFTFRFGTIDDLIEELDGDEDLAARVEEDLSLSLLTVPLTEVPPTVAAYRDQGYVTVVRLPAVSDAARDEISERISRLLASPAPLMMFLERLELLSVKASLAEEPILLKRHVESNERGEPWQRVVLDDVSFRVFTARIDPVRLQRALNESVENGALDKRWLKWETDAFVSVAVGDGFALHDGRFFTYLPMGEEAETPFCAHINAPFVTNLARLGLDHEQPVNKLMMDCIAELCLGAASAIAEADGDANTYVDLLAWSQRVGVLDVACKRTVGGGLSDFVALPTVLGEWRSLSETRVWHEQLGTRVITGGALTSDCGAVLADPRRIDADRLTAAGDLAKSVGLSLDPPDAQKADWTESLAAAMRGRNSTLTTWTAFYDDLPLIFASGEPLHGRAILYSADESLARCNEPLGVQAGGSRRRARQRSVFFSPRAKGDRFESDDTTDDSLGDAQGSDGERVDIRPPRTLSNRITFMHPELDWYSGSQRRPGREFLENTHLVQPFRTERLLSLMARVMSDSPSEALMRDSLHFAFRLLGGQVDRHARDLAAVGLRVPTQSGGWIPATSARFGGSWSLPGADDLAQLAAAATEETPELASLPELLVADQGTFSGSDPALVPRWQAFLTTLGVSTTLPIREALDKRTISGRHLTTERITSDDIPDGVPAGVVEQWRAGLDESGNRSHPETAFTTADPLCWFLGQHEVGLLPGRYRLRYAQLVVRTLPTLQSGHLASTWTRRQPYGTDSQIPTPLACFLGSEEWVPNQRSGDEPEFRTPGSSWYVGIEDQMAAYYSPLVEARLRRTFESMPNPGSLMRLLGLRIWGSRDDAAALVDHLTELFEAREVNDAPATDHLRSSLADAWDEIGDPGLPHSPTLESGLIVERGGHLALLGPDSAGADRVFVTGARDMSTTAKLVRELGWAMLTVNTDDPDRLREIADHVLKPHWHDDVVVTPEWHIEVLMDGQPWRPKPDAVPLTEEVPWLPLVFACTMRFPRSGTAVGKSLERRLDDLARIRLERCSQLSIATGGGEQTLPPRLHGVLPVPGDQPTLLLEADDAPLNWGRLDSVALAALELVGQTRFATELALTLGRLASEPDMPAEAPDTAAVAEALGIEPVRVAEMEGRVYGAVSVALARLLPAAVCLWGEQAFDALTFDVPTREEVLDSLTQLTGDTSEAARVLRISAEATDANAVRLALSIPLRTFNGVIKQHFPFVPPVDNSGRHFDEFRLRRTQRRPELLNWLRASRLPMFEAGQPQPDWTELRELDFLTPDPDWGTSLDDLPEHVVDDRIDRQMTEATGPRPSSSTLPAAVDVRQINGAPLREKLAELQKLAIAWCRKQNLDARFDLGPDFVDVVMRRLDGAGALDFVPLDGELLAVWMHRISAWPEPMPLTTDRAPLGLTDADLLHATTERDTAREERLKAERQVTVHGSVIDLEPSMANLIERLSGHLATQPVSLATPYRFASLQKMPGLGRGDGGGSGSKPPTKSSRRSQRLSDAQRNAIGIAGELTAFHWLRAKERSPVDETCWKSTYVSYVYEGAQGNDGLGYDFEVPRSGGSVMYEVKATSGDASTIELGESEVACAQQHARSTRWRLLVVEDVLSADPRVLMLPNPFGRDSRPFFRFDGNSIRLRFRL